MTSGHIIWFETISYYKTHCAIYWNLQSFLSPILSLSVLLIGVAIKRDKNCISDEGEHYFKPTNPLVGTSIPSDKGKRPNFCIRHSHLLLPIYVPLCSALDWYLIKAQDRCELGTHLLLTCSSAEAKTTQTALLQPVSLSWTHSSNPHSNVESSPRTKLHRRTRVNVNGWQSPLASSSVDTNWGEMERGIFKIDSFQSGREIFERSLWCQRACKLPASNDSNDKKPQILTLLQNLGVCHHLEWK